MSSSDDVMASEHEIAVINKSYKRGTHAMYGTDGNLAQLVLYLFHHYIPYDQDDNEKRYVVQPIDTVVDLCARSFEMSKEFLKDSYIYRCVAIDKDEYHWIVNGYEFDNDDVLGDNFRQHRLFAHNDDVFEANREYVRAPSGRPTCVYCRPPAHKPFTVFPGSLEHANTRIEAYCNERLDYLKNRGSYLLTSAPKKKVAEKGDNKKEEALNLDTETAYRGTTPRDEIATLKSASHHLLSVPEWYFALVAASLMSSSWSSGAVIVIPNRLLNLAKATDGRRLLCELKLLSAVIVLPDNFAPKVDDCSILVLTERPSSDVFFFDGRKEVEADGSSLPCCEFIELLERAGLTDSRLRTQDHRLEFTEAWKTNWSFLKHEAQNQSMNVDYVPLAEWMWTREVKRGVSKKYIDNIDYEPDFSEDSIYVVCSYISIAPYKNGEISPLFPDYPGKMRELLDFPRRKLNKIKALDPRYPVLLISRIGPPFKLVLLDTSYWEAIDAFKYEPDPYEIFIPADGLLYVSLQNETAAQYLLAFLSSTQGQQCLELTAHGNKSKQLSTKDLRMMLIPDVNVDEQKRLGGYYVNKQKRYEEALKEIEAAQQRAEKLAEEKCDMMQP